MVGGRGPPASASSSWLCGASAVQPHGGARDRRCRAAAAPPGGHGARPITHRGGPGGRARRPARSAPRPGAAPRPLPARTGPSAERPHSPARWPAGPRLQPGPPASTQRSRRLRARQAGAVMCRHRAVAAEAGAVPPGPATGRALGAPMAPPPPPALGTRGVGTKVSGGPPQCEHGRKAQRTGWGGSRGRSYSLQA